MREKIFCRLRSLSLAWLGHSPATEQKQAELQKIEARRTYMFDQTVVVLKQVWPIDLGSIQKLVEVGIGMGGFTHRLRQERNGAFIVGIDPEVLSANPAADRLIKADGRFLPLKDQAADAVLSSFLLHVLVEPAGLSQVRQLIGEAQRVGKKIVFMDILGSLWTVLFATLGAVLLERVTFGFMIHTFRVMLSCLTRREYENLAQELGLRLLIWGPNSFYPKVAILYSSTD